MSLRELFPNGRFGPPLTDKEISGAEERLGACLPPQLRALYRECNGFRESLGNASYLLPLIEEDGVGSLVSITEFWWREWPKINQGFDARPYIFFGSSSSDEYWGIRQIEPFDLIAYHYGMGDLCEARGFDIAALFASDLTLYDDVGL